MKVLYLFAALLLTACAVQGPRQQHDKHAGYHLVFSDEFDGKDGSRPDPTKWRSCERHHSTWNRWIKDTTAVAYIDKGNLVLKAIPNDNPTADKAAMLTGAVETRDLYSFKHGKVEVRAKVYAHTGTFPAIWMMPQSPQKGWPACGEIDIFETIDTQSVTYHTVHSHWTYTLGHTREPRSSFSAQYPPDRYHIYGFEWEEGTMRWYVDGTLVGSYSRSTDSEALAQGQWPFEQEFYLILNQSVGNGSWAAPADTTHTYRMEVDWVRVYQKTAQKASTFMAR